MGRNMTARVFKFEVLFLLIASGSAVVQAQRVPSGRSSSRGDGVQFVSSNQAATLDCDGASAWSKSRNIMLMLEIAGEVKNALKTLS